MAEDGVADAGTDKSRLLSAQIWLKDIAKDFAGMNEIWDASRQMRPRPERRLNVRWARLMCWWRSS